MSVEEGLVGVVQHRTEWRRDFSFRVKKIKKIEELEKTMRRIERERRKLLMKVNNSGISVEILAFKSRKCSPVKVVQLYKLCYGHHLN